eukprot:203790-Pleurochrysis_carterae.AAC.1
MQSTSRYGTSRLHEPQLVHLDALENGMQGQWPTPLSRRRNQVSFNSSLDLATKPSSHLTRQDAGDS